jgi:hypothetical protein
MDSIYAVPMVEATHMMNLVPAQYHAPNQKYQASVLRKNQRETLIRMRTVISRQKQKHSLIKRKRRKLVRLGNSTLGKKRNK